MYNEIAKRASLKYQAKQKTITFRVKPEVYAEWEEIVKDSEYKSMRQFMLTAFEHEIERIKESRE